MIENRNSCYVNLTLLWHMHVYQKGIDMKGVTFFTKMYIYIWVSIAVCNIYQVFL